MIAPFFYKKQFTSTLLKSATILFVVCFFLYLPFSRQPDYFDSEKTPAIIIKKEGRIFAEFTEYGKYYYLPLDSKIYQSRIGERVEVIYELRAPAHAKIYTMWGYWFIPVELAWSFGAFSVLIGIAYATTHRPHPTAIEEQLKGVDAPKKKYK